MVNEALENVYTKFKLHFYKSFFEKIQNRETSLTTVETYCIEIIAAMGNPTVSEFASFIQISSPNAAYKINSLVKKGYLRKIQSKSDRREYHLEVTKKYLDYYNLSSGYVSKVADRMKEEFSQEELMLLEKILKKTSDELMPEVNIDKVALWLSWSHSCVEYYFNLYYNSKKLGGAVLATVKRKGHLNVKRVVITALVFILIIAGIVTLICINKNKKGKNSENTNEPSVNRNDYIKDGEFIKITTDDCSLYVGTTLTLSIEGSDDKVLQSVAFKSSDKDIVSVDEKGNVRVNGTGTAIITATSGLLTDSVVIAGIDKEAVTDTGNGPVSEPALPVYIPDGNGGVVPKETKAPENDNNDNTSQETTATVERETGSGTNIPDVIPTNPDRTEETESEDNYKDILMNTITSLGYKRYKQDMDFAYIYEEDGNYLGEVIIDDNQVQIYVQTRTMGFDNALIELIKCVCGNESNNVFRAFTEAQDNKTIIANGHTIRIRPASDSGHSKLIISY